MMTECSGGSIVRSIYGGRTLVHDAEVTADGDDVVEAPGERVSAS